MPWIKRLSLSVRIFIVYVMFVGVSSYYIFNTVFDEIKPAVRQATEDTLVDTANLLAELLREPLKNNQLQATDFSDALSAYGQRHLHAKIWGIEKTAAVHRIYVTDKKGIVVFDSTHQAEGQDYSKWNDVYLTLHGQYGARSTAEIPDDSSSSVMYVAAPILDGKEIIGVVSVAKPNRSVQPFINKSRGHLTVVGAIVILAGLLVGILFSWWLAKELRALRAYARAVAQGERAVLPQNKLASGELNQLAQSLESMRVELDGKAYVEIYVQTLTHELKSPLAGIRAAAELLQTSMPEKDKTRFLQNIDIETQRMQQMIERLLNLARVEQQQVLHDVEFIELHSLWQQLIDAQSARSLQRKIRIKNLIPINVHLMGERFLLQQAFANLLENSLDFAKPNSDINIEYLESNDQVEISITNEGEVIPEFALARVTEKFYSLPRPDTGKKSSGLGLSFVQEAAHLHQAKLVLSNWQSGVKASLYFPLAATHNLHN